MDPASGRRCRPAGSAFPKYPRCLEPGAVRRALLATGGYPSPPTSGNAYARWFLEALSPIEGHSWMDPLLISAAPLYGDVVTVNRPLGIYRCHGSNDSAQSIITAHRFERYVADERARIEYLEHRCKELGVAFDVPAATARNVAYQEARLMAAKLGGRSSLAPGWSGIAAILCSAQSLWQRSLRSLWVAMVALLPLVAARKLIKIRYMPARRPRSIEVVARIFEHRRRARPRPNSDGS